MLIRVVTPMFMLWVELLFVISRGMHDIPICALARGARQSLGPVWAWGRKAVPGMWANLGARGKDVKPRGIKHKGEKRVEVRVRP